MDARTRQYLFALIFIAFGIYQLVIKDYQEFALYTLAGTAFIFNSLASEPRFFSYKRLLVIITWVLMIATALLFLYLLQFRYL